MFFPEKNWKCGCDMSDNDIKTFPIFRDTCFLNLIEVGGVSVARSMSLRWRGVRLHWDNAFLPLNIVLLGLIWTRFPHNQVVFL